MFYARRLSRVCLITAIVAVFLSPTGANASYSYTSSFDTGVYVYDFTFTAGTVPIDTLWLDFESALGNHTVNFAVRAVPEAWISMEGIGSDGMGSFVMFGLEDLFNGPAIQLGQSLGGFQVGFSDPIEMINLRVSANADSYPVSQVPIPGAAWLLGSGLAGLFCLRKRFIA